LAFRGIVPAAAWLAVAAAGVRAEVRGRAALDDGLPTSGPIRVELLCPGRAPAVAEADSEGRFGFDADAPPDCLVRASYPGYTPDSVAVGSFPLEPDIVALAPRREGKWQGFALSATALAANEASRAAFARSHAALLAGDLGAANEAIEEAVAADATHAEAWFQLGGLRLAFDDAGAARDALRRALAADPWFVSPYRPLLLIEMAEGRSREARELCDRLLALTPHLADARYYRALANLDLGDEEAARADAQAIERGPVFAPLHHLRGLLLEAEGRREEALAEYRRYLDAEPDGPAAAEVRARLEASR
jgi:tetratricopeptide (TPR) repeat protein